MKAKFTERADNAKNYNGNKELVNSITASVLVAGQLKSIVDARFYMGRSSSSSVVYCSMWVHATNKEKSIYTSGTGSAGGGGYHKESQALANAIDSANIGLYGRPYAHETGNPNKIAHIGGCGEESMKTAITAIVKILFPRHKVYLTR
jgi:hypothetical protein